MNKLTYTLILFLLSFCAIAQKKESVNTPVPPKPVYKKVIILDVQDFNTFTEALQQWKRLIIYDPQSTSDNKVQTSQSIDTYITALMQKVKMDSVRMDSIPRKK